MTDTKQGLVETPRTDQLTKMVDEAWRDGGFQLFDEAGWLDEYRKLEIELQQALERLHQAEAQAQRDAQELRDVLRGVMIVMNTGAFSGMENEPWATRVRAAMKEVKP